jgi:hypothetical protein
MNVCEYVHTQVYFQPGKIALQQGLDEVSSLAIYGADSTYSVYLRLCGVYACVFSSYMHVICACVFTSFAIPRADIQ